MSRHDVAPGPKGARNPRTAAPGPGTADRNVWWTRKAVGLHATIVVVVPVFLALFWWQIQRVRQGNTLSWAYVFEWPFFTGYAVYLWWKLVHDQTAPDVMTRSASAAVAQGTMGAEPLGVPAEPAQALQEALTPEDPHDVENAQDAELAAYNRYLAELHASGRRKRW